MTEPVGEDVWDPRIARLLLALSPNTQYEPKDIIRQARRLGMTGVQARQVLAAAEERGLLAYRGAKWRVVQDEGPDS